MNSLAQRLGAFTRSHCVISRNKGEFSLISTELEMTGHTNPTRQRGFREP